MRSKSVGPALAVLFLVNVLNYYDRQTLAAILEPLEASRGGAARRDVRDPGAGRCAVDGGAAAN